MNQDRYVFSQLTDIVYQYDFDKCVAKYHGNKKVKKLSCYEQFLSMLFGQLSNLESLRSITNCLQAHQEKLYHLGFSGKISRSTLADANEKRDWRIYRDFAQILIKKASKLYLDEPNADLELKETCYVIDASVIELCLNMFRWAKLKTVRAAVKLNMQMDLRGNIPSFFTISSAKDHDLNFLDEVEFEADAYYILDRGYIDFKRLYHIHEQGSYFVIRAKKDLSFDRIYSNRLTTEDKDKGVRCDQIIKLKSNLSQKKYPEKLRRVKFFEKEQQRYYVFLTNNFNVSVQLITELYRNRWQVETFFKWIKQHLKIKTFWGRSSNAVRTQICIALCAYLVVAIAKKQLKIERNLYEILQILNISLIDKKPLKKLISESDLQSNPDHFQKQVCLPGF